MDKNYKSVKTSTTTFDDVIGLEEVVEEVKILVDYLKDPSKYKDIGAKMTKGVLFTGKPGTGKTLIARAIAGEANVPFFYANGSEFDELFIGVGAKRIREIFGMELFIIIH